MIARLERVLCCLGLANANLGEVAAIAVFVVVFPSHLRRAAFRKLGRALLNGEIRCRAAVTFQISDQVAPVGGS